MKVTFVAVFLQSLTVGCCGLTVVGDERADGPVQCTDDECTGAVRRHAGHFAHPLEGPHSQHEHHRTLLAHGHLPEPRSRP